MLPFVSNFGREHETELKTLTSFHWSENYLSLLNNALIKHFPFSYVKTSRSCLTHLRRLTRTSHDVGHKKKAILLLHLLILLLDNMKPQFSKLKLLVLKLRTLLPYCLPHVWVVTSSFLNRFISIGRPRHFLVNDFSFTFLMGENVVYIWMNP